MQLHTLEEDEDSTTEFADEEYVLHELGAQPNNNSEWIEKLVIEDKRVCVKLDSGASCNVLPKEVFAKLPKHRQRLRP